RHGHDGAGPDGAVGIVRLGLFVRQGRRQPRAGGHGRAPRPRRMRAARQLRLEFYRRGCRGIPRRLRNGPFPPVAGREGGISVAGGQGERLFPTGSASKMVAVPPIVYLFAAALTRRGTWKEKPDG